MSVFEDKIRRNKNYFNQREPDLGHKERFISKLNEADISHNQNNQYGLTFKIAASLIVLISLGLLLTYLLTDTDNSNEELVNTITYSQDMNDILAYYDAVSMEKVNQIDNLVPDPEQANELKKTAINRLDDIDGSLAAIEKELVKNPDDENIKSALINNKRKKVAVMEKILFQIDFASSSLF